MSRQKEDDAPQSTGVSDAERIGWARGQFEAAGCYLNTATLGLPPRTSSAELMAAHDLWRTGLANVVAYDIPLERSRTLYAGLVGLEPGLVATGSQTSAFVGVVAASLSGGAEVLTADNEFTSVTFPFHAQPAGRLKIVEVPLHRLADSVSESTDLVAVAAVQSSDGTLADLDSLVDACAATSTKILLDVTQAVGWLPVDASRFTYTVCSGYKWLLAARGTAFFSVSEADLGGLVPASAGWYAGADPWQSIYGTPLRLADNAKRLDLSPAWLSWVSQAPALELLSYVGLETLHSNAISLSNAFAEGVGLPSPQPSAIVSLGIDDEVPALMEAAGIRAAMRAGRLRLSFHISTTENDVDQAIDVLSGHVVAA